MDTAEVPDLGQLMEDVQTACDALPCNLDDYWLEKIADDLEAFFVDEENQGEEVEPNLSAPLFLVLNILEYKEGCTGNFSGEIEVSTEDLFKYFRDYLIEVTLEIVSRRTDIKVESATLDTIFTERKVMIFKDDDFFNTSREAMIARLRRN